MFLVPEEANIVHLECVWAVLSRKNSILLCFEDVSPGVCRTQRFYGHYGGLLCNDCCVLWSKATCPVIRRGPTYKASLLA